MRTIETKTADDGTELQIKKRGDGDFIVTEKGSSGRTGEVARSRQEAERQLNETSRLYGVAEESKTNSQPSGMGGGLFGGQSGGMDSGMDADTTEPGLFGSGDGMDMGGADDEMGGGLFGGGGTSDDNDNSESGGLFGGSSGLFGGGGSSRVRDPGSGKFAPKRRESVDFEMERDSQGRFKGREETGGDDGDGFLDRFL
jgi:hypothetical protein